MNHQDPEVSQPSISLDKPIDKPLVSSNRAFEFEQTEAPESEPEPESPELRQYTLIIYILFLIGIVTGLSSLIGVIMAYVERNEMVNTPFEDHMTFLIRTFWIGLIASVIGIITTPIIIGFLIMPLVFVWYTYRCIVGFIKFNDKKPIDPLGWW